MCVFVYLFTWFNCNLKPLPGFLHRIIREASQVKDLNQWDDENDPFWTEGGLELQRLEDFFS